jgi:FkbM family methyltransferase
LFLLFNRPDLTRRVFERIREARPAQLFVAADGPRPDRPGEAALCAEARRVMEGVDWPCAVTTLFRGKNMGCRSAVGSALTWFFEQVEAGIILEDDCLPDPSFFPYCAELLVRYKDHEQVLSISGDCFQPDGFEPGASYYFSFYQHIWGWATWRRAWQHYQPKLEHNPCLLDIEWLCRHLDSKPAGRYWRDIIERYHHDQIDTWDYPWLFSCWAHQGLGIVPARNLVTNIGFDSRATHTANQLFPKAIQPAYPMPFPLRHPDHVSRSSAADHAFEELVLLSKPIQPPAPHPAGGLRILSALRRITGQILQRVRRPISSEQREAARLRQLPRYQATTTPLLSRLIQIVDAPTFLAGRQEIFDRKVYDFEAGRSDPVIIDCGANIGLSVIFFKQRYPAARLVAFEADPNIFRVLEYNVGQFGFTDVALHNEAVWTHNGELSFCLEGGFSGRLPKGDGDAPTQVRVQGCRLRDVLTKGPVDFLKLDIEGAEAAVLEDCREFVRSDWIRHLFLEYHSHAEEPQVLHEILALLTAGGYRYHVDVAYARKRPFVDRQTLVGMDLQLNVYAYNATSI